jgi:hypothetical protein
MGLTSNQQKGNTAEYLVLHELEGSGIRAWQLGGNNRRWDIVFQGAEDDDFIPAQVKARTGKTIVFRGEDASVSRGYYFVCYTPVGERDRRTLREETLRLLNEQKDSVLLVFDSAHVVRLCDKAKNRASNQGKSYIYTDFDNGDVTLGLKTRVAFFEKFVLRSGREGVGGGGEVKSVEDTFDEAELDDSPLS